MAASKSAPKKVAKPTPPAAKKAAAKPAPKAAKPVVKAKPAPKKVVAKPAAKPVAKAPVKAAPKKAVAKPAAKPVAKAPAKPVAKAPVKPVAKAPAKPVAKAPAKPVAKAPAKPAAKAPAAKPAAKAPAKPVAKAVVAKSAPVAKAPAKPAAKTPAKVVAPVVEEAPKTISQLTAKYAPIAKPIKKKVTVRSAPKPKTGDQVAKKPVKKPKPLPKPPEKAAPTVQTTLPIPVKKIVKPEVVVRTGKIVVPKTSVKTAVKFEPDFVKSVLHNEPQPEQTAPPANRYSDAELAEFRELINRKLDSAKKELAYLQGLITRKDEMGGDNDDARYMTMEDGSLSMEREQLSQMASRQITFVDHLEKALRRIESKTYGICRVTGKLIDKARLRAVPHATLSVEAKMGKVRQP